MLQQITDTFTITIKGKPNNYTIEATDPKRVQVDLQPFIWFPTPKQTKTPHYYPDYQKSSCIIPNPAISQSGSTRHPVHS